jgi:hypothetical protein
MDTQQGWRIFKIPSDHALITHRQDLLGTTKIQIKIHKLDTCYFCMEHLKK